MATLSKSGVFGKDEIKLRLRAQTASYGSKVAAGLKIAGLYLQGESQKLVPVDYGVLKASAFTRAEGAGARTVVNVGFTAAYAMFVHENLNGLDPGRFGRPRSKPHKGYYWDPQGRGQSKFLEMPARDPLIRARILELVKSVVFKGEGGAKG